MKLVALLFASLLAVPLAHAEEAPRQKHRAFKQALMQQFDRDGDGRLDPRERRHAARVLARIQRKLAGRDGMPQRRMARDRRGGRFEQRHMQRDMQPDMQRDAPGDVNVDIDVR